MKKKLAIIIIILLASGGITWAILNQSQDSKQQTAPLTKESSQKPKIPGGEKIIDQDSSTQDQISKESSKNQGQNQPDSSSHSTHDNQHSSQHSQQSSQKPNTSRSNTQGQAQPQPQGPSQPLNPPIKPPTPNTPPTQPQPQPPVTPPVSPPTPPQPPITPPQPPKPPKPPKPPVTPPQQNLTDKEKARKIINNLKSSANQNIAQFTNDDGQIRTVLWTKGITGPRLGVGGDFVKHDETHGGIRYVTYSAAYRPEFTQHGWYDADKAHGSSSVDINLCFGSVAANQLHWWMHNNRDYVTRFLAKTNYAAQLPPAQHGTLKDLRTFQDSFVDQQNSRFFSMMKVYFGSNREGYYADPLIDMFINGHRPKPGGGYNDPDNPHSFRMDSRGGFFHDVFKKRNLTRRMTMSDFKDFATEMKKAFQAGESVGVIHHTSARNTHIVTAWGLEYDLDGKLVAIYVTDSDDQDSPHNGMKRYGVRNISNNAYLSNNLSNPNSGAKVDQISTLGLGEDKWNNFLK